MSSCLSGGGGGRTYGFDLDLVKPPPPTSSRSSHTSSPSSTLSESSNSALAISIKKARTPRKRPNQTYNEAAALLSTIYPNVFSTKGLKKPSKSSVRHFSFPEPSDVLLPPLPVLFDAAFLLRKPHLEEPTAASQIKFKHRFAADKDCRSPASISATCSFEPNSPEPFDDDFDAESILEEEIEEGIDSIMGNLSVSTPSEQDNTGELLGGSSAINPLLRSFVGCRISGSHTDQIELGLGLGLEQNLQWALKAQNDCEWWRTPTVPVQNMVPNFKPPAPLAPSEKKKKKVAKEKMCYKKITDRTVYTDTPKGKLKASLGLKLNHEEVLKEWSDRSSMFLDGANSPELSANAMAKLADLDLLPDASGERETSVTKYKEKRRSRLFCKKIRYQVQKMNADKQPRMKAVP